MKSFKVVVLGCGYVGSSLIESLVSCGDEVVAIDIEKRQLDRLETWFQGVEARGSLSTSVAMKASHRNKFDFAIIAVPTPLSENGGVDLSFVEDAALVGVSMLGDGGVLILESTSYPGTTRQVLGGAILQRNRGKDQKLGFGFSSERIDPGNRAYGLNNVPKVISGSDETSLSKMNDLYSRFVDVVVPANTIEDAEMSKVLENTYRAVNIALVNAIASSAKKLGVNIHEAVRLAATKPFGFQRFTPGIGVGGHCIPIDPIYLNAAIEKASGKPVNLISQAISVNNEMPQFTSNRAVEVCGELGFSDITQLRVLLFGISYKPNSGDIRQSAALEVLNNLRLSGFQNLYVFDPNVSTISMPGAKKITERQLSELDFDLCLNLTIHDSWSELSASINAGGLLDCWDNPGKFQGKIFGLFF